ncbi:hypothetical protein [Roseivivax sp. CAU 1761]
MYFKTATIVFAAGALFAGPALSGMADERLIHSYAPGADVSQLSQTHVQSLLNVIHSSESRSDTEATVKSLIRRYNDVN